MTPAEPSLLPIGGERAVARVVLDSPLPQLDRLFDYAIPPELADAVVPGVRVKVPFRSAGRLSDAFVVEVGSAGSYEGALSPVDSVVSPIVVLTPEVWRLARAVADRGAGSAIDVLRFAIPGRQARVEKAHLAAAPSSAAVAAAPSPEVPDAVPSEPEEGPSSAPHGAPSAALTPDPFGEVPESVAPEPEKGPSPAPHGGGAGVGGYPAGRWESAIDARARWASAALPGVVECSPGRWVGRWALTLAQAAAHTLASGSSAILAVPDYRDQDQLQAALESLLPAEAIARTDARQSNPDRYRAFLSCLGDEPRVILGTRSAVYAPARRLGLLALWDEGDPLHAEPLAPYAHSRDVALLRQEQSGAALAFLSHSRSTEVERLVGIGWLHDLAPSSPIGPRVIPTVQQAAQDGFAQVARIPSTAWRAAREALDAGPVLVQVARPGYAPVLACQSCGQAARCNRCNGPLGKSSASAVPSCGWCGALAADWHCTHCSGERLRFVSVGAGRTAEELGRAFPGVRVVVADGERPVQEVPAKPALVVATRGAEPITPGGYAAVLLLDGERMLARESLRVGEDCLRWWSNAASLAAPKAPVMLVGVGGPLARALNTWRQADYARAELADRRALRFPPAVRAGTIVGAAEPVAGAVESVREIPGVDVLGPVDAEPGLVRAIVRFDYGSGGAVASALRSAVVRNASTRRKGTPGKGAPRPQPSLRVRFDDPEIF
ncbi:primosomal protein N' [Microbacteriaceae bacterium 4G12]